MTMNDVCDLMGEYEDTFDHPCDRSAQPATPSQDPLDELPEEPAQGSPMAPMARAKVQDDEDIESEGSMGSWLISDCTESETDDQDMTLFD